jgi:hypothetical protein
VTRVSDHLVFLETEAWRQNLDGAVWHGSLYRFFSPTTPACKSEKRRPKAGQSSQQPSAAARKP